MLILFLSYHVPEVISIVFPFLPGDAPGSVDMDLVQVCSGGSAVLPCHTPNSEGLAVEGVILNRKMGRAPVEVAYHSRQLHSSLFPTEAVLLSSAPGPGGITFNMTLLQLQPEDSALYSCRLLLRGRADGIPSLSGHVFFISVQGGLRHKLIWIPAEWCVFL